MLKVQSSSESPDVCWTCMTRMTQSKFTAGPPVLVRQAILLSKRRGGQGKARLWCLSSWYLISGHGLISSVPDVWAAWRAESQTSRCSALKGNMNANTADFHTHPGKARIVPPYQFPLCKIQDHLEVDQGVQTAALLGILRMCPISSLHYKLA